MNPWAIMALFLGLVMLGVRLIKGSNPPLTAAVTTLVLIAASRVAADAGLLVVYTPSVPVGLYWRRAIGDAGPAAGEYVCINSSAPGAPTLLQEGLRAGWLPAAWLTEPLVKRVAGVPGDRVSYEHERGVLINGELLPRSRARPSNGDERIVPYPGLPHDLESGEVWLASEHVDGFDSRYFGPVQRAALSCVAEPVWTW